MTINTNAEVQQDTKQNDKEHNFRQLEAKYQRELEKERAARIEAERKAQEAATAKQQYDDEDDDSEPYVDKRRLQKTLNKFSEHTQKMTQGEIQKAVQTALSEERRQNWIKGNPDFYEVLQHADKFAEKNPELAETILEMPDTFERQKLVYKNIKALNAHLPEPKQPSIQDKIDQNRRSPYYQPSGMGSAPYQAVGDFSNTGQKQAYEKMQELKSRLRI